jgi:hypothetical protein
LGLSVLLRFLVAVVGSVVASMACLGII